MLESLKANSKDAWLKANKDKVFDKTVKVANGATAGGVAKAASKPEVDVL